MNSYRLIQPFSGEYHYITDGADASNFLCAARLRSRSSTFHHCNGRRGGCFAPADWREFCVLCVLRTSTSCKLHRALGARARLLTNHRPHWTSSSHSMLAIVNFEQSQINFLSFK